MWRLLIIMGLIINFTYAKDDVKNKIVASNVINSMPIITKFDFIVDEDITDNDPRIKSIIYSAKSDKNSHINIAYYNPNAEKTATKLAFILEGHGLLVLKPKVLNNSNQNSDSHYVFVSILY